MTAPVRVLMVCLGNICRSPTAHIVFARRVAEAGLQDQVLVDSAGTGDWHIGHPPDARSCAAAAARGYDMSALRARQVQARDFHEFDLVLAMDENNLRDLQRLAPPQHRHKLRLFMDFADMDERSVPDPYYGEAEDFQRVLDLVETAADALLRHLRQRQQE
jgi:protein-tyrosine phosphatase